MSCEFRFFRQGTCYQRPHGELLTARVLWKIYRREEVPASRRQHVEFPTGTPTEAATIEARAPNLRSIFDMSREPMAVLDDQARLVIANPQLYRLLDVTAKEAEGEDFFRLGQRMLEGTDLREGLENALKRGEDFQSTRFTVDEEGRKRTLYTRGRIVPQHTQRPYRILLSFEDE